MSCPQMEELLNDCVDGALDGVERQKVERHLGSCVGCRTTVKMLRALIDKARALPRGIDPPRDLLPAIREGVLPQRTDFRWMRIAALAASALILSAAVITSLQFGERPAGDPGETPLLAASPEMDDLRAVEQGYIEATEQLLSTIETQRDRLSPETQAVLDKNLAIIDHAIAEVQAALAEDPGDTDSGLVLTTIYQQKLGLLQRFSRLSS